MGCLAGLVNTASLRDKLRISIYEYHKGGDLPAKYDPTEYTSHWLKHHANPKTLAAIDRQKGTMVMGTNYILGTINDVTQDVMREMRITPA